jgi:hypothetical protein
VGSRTKQALALVATVGVSVAAGAAAHPSADAADATWSTYRDDANRFSIALPPTWLPAARFLASPGFARFTRRHPALAGDYRRLVRRARGRFPFLAFDASARALRDADDVNGRSYGLFPTVFVLLSTSEPLLPVVHDEVVPTDWGGGGPGKQGCSLDKSSRQISRRREAACGFFYHTYRGVLLMVESRVAGKPPGRPWAIVGLAFAHTTSSVDASRDEPNRTYQAALQTVRYLP